MSYAVLQQELAVPPVESLKRAFRTVGFLTAIDAHTLANDAFGILVKGLTGERAFALQAALRAEGIETDVVEEQRLPALPQTKFVRRLACSAEGLDVYDPLNRSFRLEWKHLLLLAAGRVRLTEFREVRQTRTVMRLDSPLGDTHPEEVVETRRKEEQNDHLLCELVLARGVQRFSLDADQFDFRYLADRLADDPARNLALLVQDLARFAPHLALNRGAYYLRESAPEVFAYPSKNAFWEEITWLLWRLEQARQA